MIESLPDALSTGVKVGTRSNVWLGTMDDYSEVGILLGQCVPESLENVDGRAEAQATTHEWLLIPWYQVLWVTEWNVGR